MRVIIVDDHEIFRRGLALILQEFEYVILAGQATNGNEFIELLKTTTADIVFMDIQMPVMNGIEATRLAVEKYSGLKIIALSMHNEREYLEKMLLSGAKGFILKNAGLDEIERALNVVMAGNNYFSAEMMTLLAQNVSARSIEDLKKTITFTARELEVLEFLCKGMTTSEIAAKLFLSERTVEKHRAGLLEKTGSKNTANLIIYAIKKRMFVP